MAASAFANRQAYLVLANLDANADKVQCVVRQGELPYPILSPQTATLIRPAAKPGTDSSASESALDVKALTTDGVKIPIPADTAVLIRLRQRQGAN